MADNTTPTEKPAEAPQAAASVSAPAPQKKSNKTGLIVGLSVGGVVGLIVFIIIGFVVYNALFAVSKEDYREAVRTGNNIVGDASKSYSSLTKISYISSYSTETQIKNDVSDAKDALAKYKEANGKFKDLRALKDGDVKKAYDDYSKKYDSYVAYADSYIASAGKALPAISECEDVSKATVSDVASFKAAIVPCQDALKSAEDISDKDLKTFIAAYKQNVTTISGVVDQVAAVSDSDYTTRSKLRQQIYDATDKLRDAQKDANSNIQKRLKEVSPREAYNDLGDLLTDKQRK